MRGTLVVAAVGLAALGLALWFAPSEAPSPPAPAPPAAPEPPARPARSAASPVPATKPKPTAARPAPAPPRFEGARGPAAVRAALEGALVDGLGRAPSDAELDAMTDAVVRMRAARAALRALEGRPGEGGEKKRLTDAVAQAGADFETHAGMPLSTLTSRVGGGVTPSADADADDEVVLVPLEAPE